MCNHICIAVDTFKQASFPGQLLSFTCLDHDSMKAAKAADPEDYDISVGDEEDSLEPVVLLPVPLAGARLVLLLLLLPLPPTIAEGGLNKSTLNQATDTNSTFVQTMLKMILLEPMCFRTQQGFRSCKY